MGIAGSIMVLIMAWWIAWFMLLPFGMRSQSEDGQVEPGTDPSAPVGLNLGRKALWACVIAVVFWGLLFGLIQSGWLDFEQFPQFRNR